VAVVVDIELVGLAVFGLPGSLLAKVLVCSELGVSG